MTTPTERLGVDLEYNVGGFLVKVGTPDLDADKAGIFFPPDGIHASWPTDAINEALAIVYSTPSDLLPWIYPVFYGHLVVGYLVMPRNDQLSDQQRWNGFHKVLLEQQLIEFTDEGMRFKGELPFVTSATMDGKTVAFVAYLQPDGFDDYVFPAAIVSEAIGKLMSQRKPSGQKAWPSEAHLFIYEATTKDGNRLAGLWVGDKLDGVGDTDQLSRAILHDIHACNTEAAADLYPDFVPVRRYFR